MHTSVSSFQSFVGLIPVFWPFFFTIVRRAQAHSRCLIGTPQGTLRDTHDERFLDVREIVRPETLRRNMPLTCAVTLLCVPFVVAVVLRAVRWFYVLLLRATKCLIAKLQRANDDERVALEHPAGFAVWGVGVQVTTCMRPRSVALIVPSFRLLKLLQFLIRCRHHVFYCLVRRGATMCLHRIGCCVFVLSINLIVDPAVHSSSCREAVACTTLSAL